MATPGTIRRRESGAWTQDGAYVLTIPTASELPAAPEDDDAFAFVHDEEALYYSRDAAWLPFSAGSLAEGRRVEVWGSGLVGTVPAGGAVTLATISIPAKPYDRVLYETAYWMVPGSGATNFQLYITGTDGSARYARGYGSVTAYTETRFVNKVEVLAANTAGTVLCSGAYVAGTSAAGPVNGDARYGRIDVVAIPVEPTNAAEPGGVIANYANVAALPLVGNEVGDVAQTLDTATLWTWTGSYWRPASAMSEWGAVATSLASQSVTTAGVTMATLSIPAKTYDRLVNVRAMNLWQSWPGSTDLYLTPSTGTAVRMRYQVGVAQSSSTEVSVPFFVSAGVAPTVTVRVVPVTTTATYTTVGGSDLNRMDWTATAV